MTACTHCTPQPSFYRRDLPFNLHDFASDEGRALFQKSLVSGKAVNFFSLSGNYQTQSDPAFCGLSSVSIVLNALAVDPGRQWKGVWRWYTEEMLDCCSPLSKVKKTGTTFSEAVCLARCNGLEVTPHNAATTCNMISLINSL
jgi:glutathione gamma-glutamylcysteinyltransferase